MHVHILGICGTFMAGVATLARELGHRVTGSDAHAYPPMSTLLDGLGIEVTEGYDPALLDPAPDQVVIGNALSRGNPVVEYVLDRGLRYTSGPAWLAENLLADRWVLAVAGTHGKTTAASLIAWILEYANLAPGFLIGGVPGNFGLSARLGDAPFFVVEADEYDTAFFDKRSKFVHYHPRTLAINNLEYDHADIFPDLAAIKTQFHHLVRTVPGNAKIIHHAEDPSVAEVLEMGCWTPREDFGLGSGQWQARLLTNDGSHFEVWLEGRCAGTVNWSLIGDHNVLNALTAIASARHAGVPVGVACEALAEFQGIKRRMEVRAKVANITLYDDFAHHPSAIATTVAGLRQHIDSGRILAILEPRSNTMRLGVHRDTLGPALADADLAWLYQPPGLDWNLGAVATGREDEIHIAAELDTLIDTITLEARPGDHLLIMSNGAFGGLHERLEISLRKHHDS